jgi:hypothetical protein
MRSDIYIVQFDNIHSATEHSALAFSVTVGITVALSVMDHVSWVRMEKSFGTRR